MVKRYAILAAAVLMVFLCVPRASFAAQTVLIGKDSVALPDIKGYHLHVNGSPMFSKVRECISICGSVNNLAAIYLSDAYDAGKTIENCMEIDFLSIVDNGIEVAPGDDKSAMLERIKAGTTSEAARKNMSAGMEKCTSAQNAHAGGIFKFKSAEFVSSLRGDNYLVSIMKIQLEKRAGKQWKTSVSYDATAHIILRGRLLTVDASDTQRQKTPEAAKEIALRLVNALNDANK